MTAQASSSKALDEQDVTLSSLLSRSIKETDAILDKSNFAESQPAIHQLLSNLQLCASLISHLNIISVNETLDDLSTATLQCLLVPYYRAALTLQVRTSGSVERLALLKSGKTFYETFIESLRTHEILSEQQRIPRQAGDDPASRRASKIAAYKFEKELQAKIESLASQRRSGVTVNPAEDEDEQLRPLLLSQLALYNLRTQNELSHVAMEIELLSNTIPMSDLPTSHKTKDDGDSTWKLDRLPSSQSWFDPSAPVLSSEGKVMRPFTILPSKLQTRLNLQSEVFRSGHRLPTMSIDEFLEQEFERGNVLQGGEADAQRQDEESRQKKELVEMDNNEAYEEGERRLKEQRDWDAYKDEHRSGEGNMIGRG